jgi:hypothetical protein
VDVPGYRWQRRRARERLLAGALNYARRDWPVCLGAQPIREGPRACSCDRMGCPAPGAHPLSAAWRVDASTQGGQLRRWWADAPEANIVLPTGRAFDVLDVPADAGARALEKLNRSDQRVGPVAVCGDQRYYFFVTTRVSPGDEDEWWSSPFDCSPETLPHVPGLRWHSRDSYVLAPPSLLSTGTQVSWANDPDRHPLPDPLELLEVLFDACVEATGHVSGLR